MQKPGEALKKRILFLCTANSCRSQMAEGIVNHFLGNKVEAFSAGTKSTFVNPRAIAVMKEIGIDISSHRSKEMTEFKGERFDYVITLCDSAHETCPYFFGGVEITHIGFPDPAYAIGSEDQIITEFRNVRDEIKERLLSFLEKI